MALVKYNDRSLRNLTTAPAAVTNNPGALQHIKTLTADGSGTSLTFVNGTSDVVLDSTYPIYKFEFINIHPATNDVELKVNFRDGGSNYDATKTTTAFRAYHKEDGSASGLAYVTGNDLAQSTAAQQIGQSGNDNDQCISGKLFLFNPSSTTFVKHFLVESNYTDHGDESYHRFYSGYCNVTAAIDGVEFSISSGNMDAGQIKLYGIKDS
tara:strand:- start:83 stop:712 length:630 start_codon:yes stop_codon:yes gene_type:complete